MLGFWLGPRLGIEPVYGMAYGVVIGGALQWLGQTPGLVRLGILTGCDGIGRTRICERSAPDGAAILGNAAVQINVMVNTNFASSITDAAGQVINGPVGWLGYAFRFMQLPLGLFGVSIAAATLPAISRSAAAKISTNSAPRSRDLSVWSSC